MNRDDIMRVHEDIRMAHKAGFDVNFDTWAVCAHDGHINKELHRFAALVAAAAKAEEREACAKACDAIAEPLIGAAYAEVAHDCAAAIRARGKE